MKRHTRLTLFILLIGITFTCSAAFAQFAQRGGIDGFVFDSTGATIPNVQVTLTDVAHGTIKTASASGTGHFQFSALVAGLYRLQAQQKGFETATSDLIRVTLGATARYDIKLHPGSVSQSVTVTSAGPLLNTDHANVDVNVSQRQMQDLPLNGLNFTSLAALAPGVSTTVEPNINPGGTFAVGAMFASGGVAFTSGGLIQGSRDNGFYINGVNINDNYESSISYEPASAALGNAKIEVADFSAANGHDISTFSIQTKGGTTAYHGSVYEYLENDALNAVNPFTNAESELTLGVHGIKPTLRRNQFGGGLGGPVYIPGVSRLKDRVFFFANYENFIEHDGAEQIFTSVPSAAERTGNFSELLSGPSPLQLYNPFSTTYDSSGHSTRTPVPNNRLDLATGNGGAPLVDPKSTGVLSLYPLPNAPGIPSYLNNYSTTQNLGFTDYHFDSRFDATLSSKDTLFVTWSRQHGVNNNSGGVFPSYVANNDDSGYLVTVNESHLFSPNLSNEFIMGIGYAALTIVNPSELSYLNSNANKFNSIFQNTGLGITRGVLGVNVYNYASPGFGQDFLASNSSLQFSDNVNWLHGRHTMTFGMNYFRKGEYDWDFIRYVNFGQNDSARQEFSSGGYDQGYAGGDGMADLVMGLPQIIHQRYNFAGGDPTAPELNVVFPYWGAYANDKFQITPKLTLSYGLRYDLNIPLYALNKLCCAVYEPNAQGGVLALPGYAPNVPQHYLPAQKTDFAPRVSVAYNIKNSLVLRAGYGMFYDAGASQISGAVGNALNGTPGYFIGSELSNVILGVPSDTPALNLSQVFQPEPLLNPGQYPVSTGPGQGYFGNGQEQAIYYFDKKSVPLPYYQRYIVDLQQQLNAQTSISFSYVGSQGRNGSNYVNINLPAYQTGWPTLNAFDAARPNNAGRFSDIYVQRPTLTSSYNAAIVEFQHRFGSQFQILSNYTFAKTVSDYPWVNNLGANGAAGANSNGGGVSGFQYPNLNDRGEAGLSHRNRFVFSGIWDPSYGATWPVWSKTVLTGWRISGIATLESGDRLTAINVQTTAADYAGFDELNVSGSPNLSHGAKSFSNQFNTAAFSAPPNGTRGNSGLGTIQGPGQNNVDLSLAKDFNIYKTLVSELRADSFNAFNHTQWNAAQTVYPNANGIPFGQASGAREARITQVSLKLSF